MPTNNFYTGFTGIWIMPIKGMWIHFKTPDYAGVIQDHTMLFENAEADSAWTLTPITVNDYNTGGNRIVGFDLSFTFIPAHNDFDAMDLDMDAMTRGKIYNLSFQLTAQDGQQKGKSLSMSAGALNLVSPIFNTWAVTFDVASVELRPRMTIQVNGKISSNLFMVINELGHKADFFESPIE